MHVNSAISTHRRCFSCASRNDYSSSSIEMNKRSLIMSYLWAKWQFLNTHITNGKRLLFSLKNVTILLQRFLSLHLSLLEVFFSLGFFMRSLTCGCCEEMVNNNTDCINLIKIVMENYAISKFEKFKMPEGEVFFVCFISSFKFIELGVSLS